MEGAHGIYTNKNTYDVLKELDPKVIAYEESFSKNLNTEEINQLNHLLEKYRNK